MKQKIKAFIKAGLKNQWINRSIDIADGDFVCEDFLEESSFKVVKGIDELDTLADGWAINVAFIYNDLAFINQVNGGSEWAIFKYNKTKDEAFQFESYTVTKKNFEKFKLDVKKYLKATNEQLIKLEF